MSRITILTISLTILLSACSKDDSSDPMTNEFRFDDEVFELKRGYYDEYYEESVRASSLSVENYLFVLTDGKFDDSSWPVDYTNYVLIYFDATELGRKRLKEGGLSPGSYEIGKDLIVSITLKDGRMLSAESGDVSVTGSFPNFTFDFDFTASIRKTSGRVTHGGEEEVVGSFSEKLVATDIGDN